jgi:O-antigen biosynthesis protein
MELDAAKYHLELDLNAQNAPSLILKQIKPGSRVLEFGPATGYMTRYMKETLGCTVVAIEIDPVAAKKAEPYCEKILVRDIDHDSWKEELSGELFDHITFADVLEHLYDPWKALSSAKGLLKKDGTVITSIPNIGHSAILLDLLQGKFEYRDTGLLDRTHIRFFTRKSMFELFDRAGLVPAEILGTLKSPDNTEFAQSYDNAAEPVLKELRKSPDSEVYQFVSVLHRTDDVSASVQKSVLALPVLGTKEYFWSVSNGQKLYINDDGEWHRYEIPVQGPSNAKIFFNLMIAPAYYEIKGLRFENTRGLRVIGQSENTIQFVSWNHEPGFAVLLNEANTRNRFLSFELKVISRTSAAVLKYEELLQISEIKAKNSKLFRIKRLAKKFLSPVLR